MLQFKIGNFALEPGEVECIGFPSRLIMSARNEPVQITRQLAVVIDQTVTGIMPNSARWNQIEAACVNFESVGFYDTESGQATPIFLSSAASLSGVRVMQPISWSPRTPVEMATHMTIALVFEADYPLPSGAAAEILDYDETITDEDDGPQRVVALETDTGPTEVFVTVQQPRRFVIQQGYIVTRSTYALPNAPLLAGMPQLQRMNMKGTPTRSGNQYLGYRVAWRYVFLVQDFGNWFPRLR